MALESLRTTPLMHSREPPNGSITIRHLDDGLKRRLRVRAAEHGRSMEEEAREILRQVVGEPAPPRNLAAAVCTRFAPFAGEGLEIPPHEPMPDPPTFDQAVR